MFDWNDLRYLLAVAREGSTLAAARSLRVNQSTVHRRLAALERALGCGIFERHPTGYRLTEIGKQLRSHAERIEKEAIALQRRIVIERQGHGRTHSHDVLGSGRTTAHEIRAAR